MEGKIGGYIFIVIRVFREGVVIGYFNFKSGWIIGFFILF